MPWILKQAGATIKVIENYSPRAFAELLPNVSFPDRVETSWIWEQGDYLLAYVEPAPVDPVPEEPIRAISAQDFRDRFIESEMDAILALAYGGDAIARRLLFKLQTQPVINLDSPELTGGLGYLVSVGVLTSARAGEVAA